MKNILVAVDFDKTTKKLLTHASQLAEKFKSKVWIIHVEGLNPDIIGYKDVGLEYIPLQRAQNLRKEHRTVQRYADQLNKKGIRAVGLLVEGPAIKTVLSESKKLKIDLLIIGSHKHSLLYRAFAEITSSAIIRKTKIPVLVVPLD